MASKCSQWQNAAIGMALFGKSRHGRDKPGHDEKTARKMRGSSP
jgi:hypothetical protein